MPTLVLIRHGQSVWNRENRFTGWWDVDLTDTGVAEAVAMVATRRLDAALWHQEHAAREALTAVLALADGTAAPPRGSPTRTATPPATAASGGHGRSARQDAPDEGTNASSARGGTRP